MTTSILVATPHVAFGELLKSSLEDTGQHKVTVVHTGKETRGASSRGNFQLAIIDSALRDQMFVPLCMDLLAQQANLRLVVIPPENDPNHPSLGGLMPHGFLTRPFYLPELIDTVSRLLTQRSEENQSDQQAESEPPMPPTWLQEPLALSRYLDQELPITQALAGIVAVDGPQPGAGSVRASSGRISQEAASELAAIVFRYWPRGEKADLVRFVRLANEKQDFLVYATLMVSNLLLILVYETSAPISMIRPQTKTLAHMLVTLPPAALNPDVRPYKPAPPEADTPYFPHVQIPAGSSVPEVSLSPVEQPPDAAISIEQPSFEPPSAAWEPAADKAPPAAEPAPPEPAEQNPAAQRADTEPDSPKIARKSAIDEPETEPLEAYLFHSRSNNGFNSTLSYNAGAEEDEEGSLEEDGGEVINLSSLLGSIPSPDPGVVSHASPLPTPGGFGGQDTSRLSRVSGGNGWERGDNSEKEWTVEDLSAAEKPPVSQNPDEPSPQAGPGFAAEDQPMTEEQRRAEEKRKLEEWLATLNQTPDVAPPAHQAAPGGSPPEPEAEPAELPDWLVQIGSQTGISPEKQAETFEQGEPGQLPEPQTSSPAISQTPLSEQPRRKPARPETRPQTTSTGKGRSPLPETEEAQLVEYALPFRESAEEEAAQTGSELVLEPERPIDPLEDTKPHVLTAITNLNQLEPVSPALSLLNYTCVLVPRLPQHYLTGELADRLAQWVHQLCLAFGWRLEGISVRPEYVQWTIQVAPSVSPGNLVRIIRQRTSLNIFTSFSHLADQNPSGDFWAIGYLIVSGAQPPSAQLLREYIAQTRKRQGISR